MYLNNIKMEFGYNAFCVTKDWINTNQLLREQFHRKEFLLQCRRNNVIPRFITNSVVRTNRIQFSNRFVCKYAENLISKFEKIC